MFDTGLDLSRWLLSAFDDDWRTRLAVPLLIVLLLLALLVIIGLLPILDRVLAPVGTGLAVLLGMVLLLPEYVCTVVLRRLKRAPPGFFHTYGDGVLGLVRVGERTSRAGLAAFTEETRVRRSLIFVVLVVVVVAGNAHSCGPRAPRCNPPLATWWSGMKSLFADETPPPAKPKTTKKPTRKPTPKKTG